MLTEHLRLLFIGAFDFVTRGLRCIDTDHANIHKGYGAVTHDYITLTASGVKEYCFTVTPENYPHVKNMHLKSLGGSVKLEILKGASVTLNTGNELQLQNPNDVSNLVPVSTIKEDPTYTGGVILDGFYVLADTTNQTVGHGSLTSAKNEELILNKGEQYIIKITELSNTQVTVFWRAFFYEEQEAVS